MFSGARVCTSVMHKQLGLYYVIIVYTETWDGVTAITFLRGREGKLGWAMLRERKTHTHSCML